MSGAELDLHAYLRRVAHARPLRADRATLQALHLAHATRIPFENVDVRLGLPISLALADLQDKLVRRGRGGYCFEHNTLFQAVLGAAGFAVEAYEARVRMGQAEVRPRTHMLLGVRLEGRLHVADVGFGGQGLLQPVPLDGEPHEQFGEAYRVVAEGGGYVVQWRRPEGWLDLYAFEAAPRPAVDFVMANHFTSTFPRSPFVQALTVQLPTPQARHVLRGRTYTVTRGGAAEERAIEPGELPALLKGTFGLDLPDDLAARIAAPGSADPQLTRKG